MIDGARVDRIFFDEFEDTRPRRELIAIRPDGSTYSADVPADLDLGDVLGEGDVVGLEWPR